MNPGSSGRIAAVIGTRPEAVKLAPVLRQLAIGKGPPPYVIASGQHQELLDATLMDLGIEPNVRLHAMRSGQSLAELCGELLAKFAVHLGSRGFSWLVVQGDTATAAMAALAASYCKIPVAHVEAGLRTQNPWNPFPEEINRRLIADLAQLHFAPTPTARNNLRREGIDDDRIHVVGNTIVDSLRHACDGSLRNATQGAWGGKRVANEKHLVLATCHRRESLEGDLAQICCGIRTLADRFRGQIEIVFPMHGNPDVHQIVQRELNNVEGVELIAPLGYMETISILRQARLVITDSGGVLEEAATLGIPTLVVRRTCERPEALEAGVARLITPIEKAIVKAASSLLSNDDEHRRMAVATDAFGDGHASKRIVDILLTTATRPRLVRRRG